MSRETRQERGRGGLVKVALPSASAWQTPDGAYRFVCPWGMDTSLRRRWIVQVPALDCEDGDWFALDDDFATLTEARESVEGEASWR
jgi:hypothetical protein